MLALSYQAHERITFVLDFPLVTAMLISVMRPAAAMELLAHAVVVRHGAGYRQSMRSRDNRSSDALPIPSLSISSCLSSTCRRRRRRRPSFPPSWLTRNVEK